MPWYELEVPGEGNCFFHVVAATVHPPARVHDRDAQRLVRRELADYILSCAYGVTLDQFMQRAVQPGFQQPQPLPTVPAQTMLQLYATNIDPHNGGNVPLWYFAYWLQFDEREIEERGDKDLRYTLWGDAAFVAWVVREKYGRGLQFLPALPPDDWAPEHPANILFLHTQAPPHFNALGFSHLRRITPMRVYGPSPDPLLKAASELEQARPVYTQVWDRLEVVHACPFAQNAQDEVVIDEEPDDETDEEPDDEEEGALSVNFLDVGMGDGTLIVCPDGTTILVDLGSTMNGDIAGRDAITFVVAHLLELKAIRALDAPTIDRLYISHSDSDHYNLLPELWLRVHDAGQGDLAIKEVFIGGKAAEYTATTRVFTPTEKKARAFKDTFFKLYPPKTYCENYHEAGCTAVDGEGAVGICVLSANRKVARKGKANPNPNSIVLLVTYAGRVVILMADAEDVVEEGIREYYAAELKKFPKLLHCDVLKAGHHGAEKGSTAPWLAITQPRRVIISADMEWSHPYQSVTDRIVASGSLIEDYSHTYLAGSGGNPNRSYQQLKTKYALYTTISQMEAGPTPLVDPKKKKSKSKKNAAKVENYVSVTGCQYQYQVLADGTECWCDTLDHGTDDWLMEGEPSNDDSFSDKEEKTTD